MYQWDVFGKCCPWTPYHQCVCCHRRLTDRDRALSVNPQQSRISAYLLWAREVRDFVVHANPTLDFSQINKRLGAMWNTLPDAKKYVRYSAVICRPGQETAEIAVEQCVSLILAGRGPTRRPLYGACLLV